MKLNLNRQIYRERIGGKLCLVRHYAEVKQAEKRQEGSACRTTASEQRGCLRKREVWGMQRQNKGFNLRRSAEQKQFGVGFGAKLAGCFQSGLNAQHLATTLHHLALYRYFLPHRYRLAVTHGQFGGH